MESPSSRKKSGGRRSLACRFETNAGEIEGISLEFGAFCLGVAAKYGYSTRMRFVRFVVSSLSLSFSAAVLMAACGDDVTFVECDANSPDTSRDTRVDSDVSQPDALDGTNGADGADTNVPDTNVPDTNIPDTRFDVDAGPDAPEKFPDTSVDGAPPPFDAGPPDPLKFTDQMEGTYCARVGGCCLALGHSAAFDNNKCINLLETYPFPAGLYGIPTIFKTKLNAGHIAFDPAAGQICLNLIRTFSCSAYGSADWIEVNRQCLAAMKGTIPNGTAGCTDSVECAQPAMCDIPDGGLSGTCKPLLQSGTSCTNSSQCGDGLTGIPRYCSNLDTFPMAPSGICQDQMPIGGECNGNAQSCLTQICNYDPTSSTFFRCAGQSNFTDPFICDQYKP